MKFLKNIYKKLIDKKDEKHDFKKNDILKEVLTLKPYTGGRPEDKKEELVDGATYEIEAEVKAFDDKIKQDEEVKGVIKALKEA